MVGGVSAVALTVVLLHEHGWRHAFSRPEFYIDAVGTAAALGIGYYAGGITTNVASGAGPWAPVIGVVVGAVAGTAAYIGGREIAHFMILLFAPEVLRTWELEKISVARHVIAGKINRLETLN
jgi:hypothetical protein